MERVLTLQSSAGNRAVARLVAQRAVIARTMTEKILVRPTTGNVTPAYLREVYATVKAALDQLEADPIQASYAKLEQLHRWQAQYAEQMQALTEEINRSSPTDPDQVGLPLSAVKVGGAGLPGRLKAVLITLNRMINELNRAFDDWSKDNDERAAKAEAAELEKQFKEQLASYKQEKPSVTSTQPVKAIKTEEEEEEEEDEDRPEGFPHKGKHAPKRAWEGKPKLLMANTEGRRPARYITRDPGTVIGWENEAREKGLLLSDNFTIVYGFPKDIGADHGEMTRFVRIDGDHGHPIIEDHQSLNTSFTAYIKKEVRLADGNQERRWQIWKFLSTLNLPTARYGIKSEPPKSS